MRLNQVRKVLDGSMESREQQIEDASKIIDNRENVIVQRPVGTGKTEVTLQALLGNALEVEQRTDESYKALITVPRGEMVDQWFQRMQNYNMDQLFDIKKNKVKNNFSNFKEIREVPSQKNKHSRSMRGVENQEFKKHKEKVFGGENVPFSNSEKIWGAHSVNADGADIVVSTYQLLHSDIQNNRVNIGNVGFNDVIIDECTSIESRDSLQNKEDEVHHGGYKVATQYQDLLSETLVDSNFIGLTAMPGRKMPYMLRDLGASLVSPDENDLTESMANISRESHNVYISQREENVFDKEKKIISKRLGELRNYAENFRCELKNKVEEETGSVGSLESPYKYANSDNDELRNSAIRALSNEQKIQALYEGGLSLIGDTFEESLPSDFSDPKIERLERLVNEFELRDENYLVFATQRKVSEYLDQQLNGSLEVVNGNKNDTHNEYALNEFGNEHDGLIMTYGYGSEGLDLPEGDHIVHMTDHLDPELKQSATGRVKRGKDIIEHTLLYDFERNTEPRENQYIEEEGMDTTPETRARLKYMLNPETSYDDLIARERLNQKERERDHILNTPPKVDS